ncbi:MAG TPA: hypothetical protein VGM59_15820 [Dongiaceae bacterium]
MTRIAKLHPIASDTVAIDFNPEGGHFDRVVFRSGGREISPLHRAPWREETLPADTPVALRNLAGDFFCAPFCAADLDGSPFHGWTSNGRWQAAGEAKDASGGSTIGFRLENPVMGASVTKEITLHPGHPVIYQHHVFTGGQGALPVGHHVMVRSSGGLTLSFSPKAFGITPEAPQEPDPERGRFALAYPQRFADLSRAKRADGTPIDLTRHPIDPRAEDVVFLVDEPGREFAWSAALCRSEGFLFFAIKDPKILTGTMLWMSNGGRFYEPWSSRHTGCLGIEELCSYGAEGHRASIASNPVSAAGYNTALELKPKGDVAIPYAFGATAMGPEWSKVADIQRKPQALRIIDVSGAMAEVPFDWDFLKSR